MIHAHAFTQIHALRHKKAQQARVSHASGLAKKQLFKLLHV